MVASNLQGLHLKSKLCECDKIDNTLTCLPLHSERETRRAHLCMVMVKAGLLTWLAHKSSCIESPLMLTATNPGCARLRGWWRLVAVGGADDSHTQWKHVQWCVLRSGKHVCITGRWMGYGDGGIFHGMGGLVSQGYWLSTPLSTPLVSNTGSSQVIH